MDECVEQERAFRGGKVSVGPKNWFLLEMRRVGRGGGSEETENGKVGAVDVM